MEPNIKIVNGDIERRHTGVADADFKADPEIRMTETEASVDTAKTTRIGGYPVVLNSYSEDLGGFIEIVREGSINRAIEPGAELVVLRDHNSSMLLGATYSGTLLVTANKRGLHFDTDPAPTTYGEDLKVLIKRGDLKGMSFGFRVLRDNWTKKDGQIIRELLDLQIFEGSFVTFPAYRATSVSLRSVEKAKELISPKIVVPDLSLVKAKLTLMELD